MASGKWAQVKGQHSEWPDTDSWGREATYNPWQTYLPKLPPYVRNRFNTGDGKMLDGLGLFSA